MTQPQESSGRTIRTVKLWIKAFIPNDYERATIVPGTGAHGGKTAITDLWLMNRCFLTDQRMFSSDIHAEARMHCEIGIDVAKCKETYQFHHCYDTIEVDCKGGHEKCRAEGSTNEMRFSDFEVSPDKQRFTFKVKAASKNPCVKIGPVQVSPNLDFSGTITVSILGDTTQAMVTFTGKVEQYPAFEMYASANEGEAQTMFQVGVAPEAGVADIAGSPERAVTGRAELRG
ncbi:MAG: hypothetical protein ABI835_20780 [Chloroflexota bacterium]